jgi:hypothetical protein
MFDAWAVDLDWHWRRHWAMAAANHLLDKARRAGLQHPSRAVIRWQKTGD